MEALLRAMEQAPAEEEPVLEAIPETRTAVRMPGEIRLFIDGTEVALDKPIILKDDALFIPLRGIASKLFFTVIDLKDGKFRLISPEGESQEIAAALIDREPMISESQLKEYFNVDTRYDPAAKILYVLTKGGTRFAEYAVEKPPELLAEERQLQEATKRVLAPSAEEIPSFVPTAARPSADLRGNTTYTYITYHTPSVFRSVSTGLGGRLYDFTVSGSSIYKDQNGRFQHDLTYLNFTRPDLAIGLFEQYTDVFPLRLQSEDFQGLKVAKRWDLSTKTTFVGGNTESSVSGASGSVKYLGRIYGVKHENSPVQWLELQNAYYYTESDADLPEQSGTTSFPRNNNILFSNAKVTLPNDVTLTGTLGQSYLHPDSDPSAFVRDVDWRTGVDWNKARFATGVAYEYAGPDYASFATPSNYNDYSGWNTYGRYNVSDTWLLYGTVHRYRNNLDDNDPADTIRTTLYSFSSYNRLTTDQSFNLSYDRYVSNPEGNSESSRTNIYRLDYFAPFLAKTRANLNFSFSEADSAGESSRYARATGLSLFRSYGRGSSWYLSQQLQENLYENDGDNLEYTASFNLYHVLSEVFACYFNVYRDRTKDEGSNATNVISGAAGFRYNILPETILGWEYNINSYNLKTEKDRWPRNWSIMFYLSQGFHLVSPVNFGGIEGRVYKDTNGSGKIDVGDAGIEGVSLALPDRREATSDAQGYFRFPYVTPGTEKVALDISGIPDDWVVVQPEAAVEVKPRKKSRLDFLAIESAALSGTVFVDANGNGIFDESEEPLEGIALTLDPGGRFTRSEADGTYRFAYLVPGAYTVSMSVDGLPVGYELLSKGEIAVQIAAGQEIKNTSFTVGLRKEPARE